VEKERKLFHESGFPYHCLILAPWCFHCFGSRFFLWQGWGKSMSHQRQQFVISFWFLQPCITVDLLSDGLIYQKHRQFLYFRRMKEWYMILFIAGSLWCSCCRGGLCWGGGVRLWTGRDWRIRRICRTAGECEDRASAHTSRAQIAGSLLCFGNLPARTG
jgi:hypothetical protein